MWRRSPSAGARAGLLAFALASLACASAPASSRFIGMNFDPAAVQGPAIGTELGRMARSGVGSVRVAWYWSALQPEAGARVRFALTDAFVLRAARRGLTVFPCVLGAPAWARGADSAPIGTPGDPRPYAALLAALAKRYGSAGTFWDAHPELRAHAITDWQAWNEPNLPYYWPQPFAGSYAALLRVSHAALRRADPRAHIVLGGLTNVAWNDLRALYAAGAAGTFDEVALQPYTKDVGDAERVVALTREVMRSHGDARKPIRLTELSWPSSAGRLAAPFFAGTSELGQAASITDAYAVLPRERRRLGLSAIYWYTWVSRERRNRDAFEFAGLRAAGPRGSRPKPAYYAFVKAVRRLRRASA